MDNNTFNFNNLIKSIKTGKTEFRISYYKSFDAILKYEICVGKKIIKVDNKKIYDHFENSPDTSEDIFTPRLEFNTDGSKYVIFCNSLKKEFEEKCVNAELNSLLTSKFKYFFNKPVVTQCKEKVLLYNYRLVGEKNNLILEEYTWTKECLENLISELNSANNFYKKMNSDEYLEKINKKLL